MKKLAIVVAFAVLSALQSSPLYAAEKLGKVFIKASSATVDGREFFNDKGREDSVKDLKERAGRFEIVDNEEEADYLIVVVDRSKDSNKVAEIKATISFKQDGKWKPGAQLTASSYSWSMAARKIVGQANDWVEARGE